MSGNNRSFCDSYTRKHFNIKRVLRALCIVQEIRQAVPVTATTWTAFGYDSGNVILFSLCFLLALAHLPSPALFAQHLFCVSFLVAFVHSWWGSVSPSKFPSETFHNCEAKHTDVRTVPCQLGTEGPILLMEALSSSMACVLLRSACTSP